MSNLRTMMTACLCSMAIACGGAAASEPARAGAAGGAAPATTAGGDSALIVVNNSSYDIYYLYMSSTSDPSWGPDQLGSAVLRSGQSFTLTGVPCGSYDIKLVDEDRDECEIRNAYMCSDAALTITNEQLLECEGYR